MLKNKSSLNFFVELFLLINSATLFIPNKYKAYPIILFLIVSVLYYKKTKNKEPFPVKSFIYISILIILYLISISYSLNFKEGFKRISTMSSMLVFPIIFGLLYSSSYYFSKKLIKKIFLSFVFSNFLFCLISFLYILSFDGYTIVETFIHYSNLINIGLGLFSIHPIYLSLFTGISILILFYLTKEKHTKSNIIYGLLILFFSIIIAVLMRKGSIIYLFISLGYLLFMIFNIKKTIIGLIVILIITAFSIQFLPKYQNYNRFLEIVNNSTVKNPNSSTSIRTNIYKCSVEKIFESPLIGYGVGNTQDKLDPCYVEKGIDLSIKTYNTHNQYFSILMTVGFLGLLIYLFSLYKIFSIFNKQKNFIGISILLFFLFNFFTENIIERENGMLLYSFFVSFFFFYQNEESNSYKEL